MSVQLNLWTVTSFLVGILLSAGVVLLFPPDDNPTPQVVVENPLNDVSDQKNVLDYGKASEEEIKLFHTFDVNEDGRIDFKEFLPVADILLGLQKDSYEESTEPITTENEYDPSFDESFELYAEMVPFNVTQLLQPKSKAAYGSFKETELKSFPGLTSWKTVNIPVQEFYTRQFKSFLPSPTTNSHNVGVPYWLWTGNEEHLHYDDMSSNRYNPREPTHEVEKVMYSLLKMFHPRPFVWMRFQPQGGAAVIRASNEVYVDIYFRFHCEFQLNEYPHLPFWFTPSQFTGHFVYAKDGSHIRDFALEVPNERKLNVDLEWVVPSSSSATNNHFKADGNDDIIHQPDMEVDIGYIPLLKLSQKSPSSPRILLDEHGNEFDQRAVFGEDISIQFDDITWDVEISEDEAKSKLEEKFYPFKKVTYHSYRNAVKLSLQQNKPLHNIVLWGALDDQSC